MTGASLSKRAKEAESGYETDNAEQQRSCEWEDEIGVASRSLHPYLPGPSNTEISEPPFQPWLVCCLSLLDRSHSPPRAPAIVAVCVAKGLLKDPGLAACLRSLNGDETCPDDEQPLLTRHDDYSQERQVQERVHGMRNPRVEPLRDQPLRLRRDGERSSTLSPRQSEERYPNHQKKASREQRLSPRPLLDEQERTHTEHHDSRHHTGTTHGLSANEWPAVQVRGAPYPSPDSRALAGTRPNTTPRTMPRPMRASPFVGWPNTK